MLTRFVELLRGGWRYATGLRRFFAVTMEPTDAIAILKEQFLSREERFLRILELGVYPNLKSPYTRLLHHAGFQFEDVKALVHEHGLEKALSHLHDAGVYLTLDEFKGRAPIRRLGLEFAVDAHDFDSPLMTTHFEGTMGGTRTDPTRVHIDLDYIAYEAASFCVHFAANGVIDRPMVSWSRTDAPLLALSNILRMARFGRLPRKWFSPTRPGWNRQALQGRVLLIYTLLVARLLGRSIPWPRYQPDPKVVVAYIAGLVRQGHPPLVVCSQTNAIRLCRAAAEVGANIHGTSFFTGGEPYTNGKAAILSKVGAECIPHYAMHETGSVAMRCGAPSRPDDLHLLEDKIAVLQRARQLESGPPVQAFFHTSLLPSLPKLMINVESGDYGVMEERPCGCLWQEVGFSSHIHTIRSYEKLTSEGVTFMGSMLHDVLEETLPSRFGGGPLDYQLVEEEEDGIPRVSLLVSPRIGPVDELAVVDAVLTGLSFADWSRRQADLWRQNGTLRVERREPYVVGAGKMLPLHVLRPAAAGPAKHATATVSSTSPPRP